MFYTIYCLLSLAISDYQSYNQLTSAITTMDPTSQIVVKEKLTPQIFVIRVQPDVPFDQFQVYMTTYSYPKSIPQFESYLRAYFTNQHKIYVYDSEGINRPYLSQVPDGRIRLQNYADNLEDTPVRVTWKGDAKWLGMSKGYYYQLEYVKDPSLLEDATKDIKTTSNFEKFLHHIPRKTKIIYTKNGYINLYLF